MAAKREHGARLHAIHPRPIVNANRKVVAHATAERFATQRLLNVERQFGDELLQCVAAEKVEVGCSLLLGGRCSNWHVYRFDGYQPT